MPGATINDYTAGASPVSSAIAIAHSMANHYTSTVHHDGETEKQYGDMSKTYIPFLNMYFDDPVVRVYSDVTDTIRVSPDNLVRYTKNPEGVAGIYMTNFGPAGQQRGDQNVQVDYEYEPTNFETPNIRAKDLRSRIDNLENLTSDDEFNQEVYEIHQLMPQMLDPQERLEFIRLVQRLHAERKKSGGVYKDELDPLPEGIRRKNRNDKGYGSYLEEIMNELQHIKKEFKSRTNQGKRYRKEASKIQDAYNELKFLKRKHDKQYENDQMLSERAIRRATGYDDYAGKDEEFNRDSVRDFFDKFK
tara:strand:- start:2392 stop:3303 length:912 start_codon:yes stop_codon:yes gene_type:complete